MEHTFLCPHPVSSSVLEKCLSRSTVRSIPFLDHPGRRASRTPLDPSLQLTVFRVRLVNDASAPVPYILRRRRSRYRIDLKGLLGNPQSWLGRVSESRMAKGWQVSSSLLFGMRFVQFFRAVSSFLLFFLLHLYCAGWLKCAVFTGKRIW